MFRHSWLVQKLNRFWGGGWSILYACGHINDKGIWSNRSANAVPLQQCKCQRYLGQNITEEHLACAVHFCLLVVAQMPKAFGAMDQWMLSHCSNANDKGKISLRNDWHVLYTYTNAVKVFGAKDQSRMVSKLGLLTTIKMLTAFVPKITMKWLVQRAAGSLLRLHRQQLEIKWGKSCISLKCNLWNPIAGSFWSFFFSKYLFTWICNCGITSQILFLQTLKDSEVSTAFSILEVFDSSGWRLPWSSEVLTAFSIQVGGGCLDHQGVSPAFFYPGGFLIQMAGGCPDQLLCTGAVACYII